MSDFPASISLATLGAQGLKLFGADDLGVSVSGAGDVNGDGFDDVIVGSSSASPGDLGPTGSAFVIFGKANLGGSLNVDALDAAQGFRIDGSAANQRAGWSVSSAGDVNRDGYDDVVVGAPSDGDYGKSYVLFGKAGGFAGSVTSAQLNGTNGFVLAGANPNDYESGYSVSSAGDVNGDGFDDVVVSSPYADRYSNSNVGSAYVVFGKESGFSASIDLNALNGTNGFRVDGGENRGEFANAVSEAGDVDGDGFDDLIVGAWSSNGDAGFSFLFYGQAGGYPAASMTSSPELRQTALVGEGNTGERSGYSVSSAGDINGDGYADLVIGAPGMNEGGAYVVFGKAGGLGQEVILKDLNGANGFRVGGVDRFATLGTSVSSAGDVNGDGLDDLLIGAPGSNGTRTDGKVGAYVLFGKTGGYDAHIDPSTLDGDDGFAIEGARSGDFIGMAVSAAGDVNGDGFDDVIVGSYAADNYKGEAYVVFGRGPSTAVTRIGTDIDQTILGGAFGDRLEGRGGSDTLDGRGGADTMLGGLGDDRFIVDNAGDRAFEQNGQGYDQVLSAVSYSLAGQYVEALTLTGTARINATGNSLANTLTGNAAANVLNGSTGADTMIGGGGSDTYYVDNAGDRVQEANVAGLDTVISSVTFSLAGQYVENLTLTGAAAIDATGNSLSNTLTGNAGVNTLTGGRGDDDYVVQTVGDKAVELDGQGLDRVLSSVSYSLAGQFIERLRLTGDGDIDATGNSLDNSIAGNGGANVINGGKGSDRLAGGAGADTFAFNTALGSSNVDVITDFRAADDTIRLDDAVFRGLSVGDLPTDAFFAGSAAGDASDRIIYDASSGALLFDRDGTGDTYAAVQFATLENRTAITAADFVVV